MTPSQLLTSAALAVSLALAPRASAQTVVVDNFDDGDVSDVQPFFGNAANDAGAGVGPTDDRAGVAGKALNLGVNPGSGNAFAGFTIRAAGTGLDLTGTRYLTFFVRPNLNANNVPVTLEINLQEDADGDGTYEGATEDEYQAEYRLTTTGAQAYRLVQIPLASFTDDNSFADNAGSDDGFDFSRVKNVVIAIGNLSGSEFGISFDEFVFRADALVTPGTAQVVVDNFDDGDVTNVQSFFGNPANDAGAGVGPTDNQAGTADRALNLGVNPGSGNAFAGFSIPAPAGGFFDATGAQYLTFFVRSTLNANNVPVTLEVNLQEDGPDANDTFDGADGTDDEFQARYRLTAVGGQPYMLVQIPIASFVDDNSFTGTGGDGRLDLSRIKNVSIAAGGLSGSPFAISFDEFAFTTGQVVPNELPPTLAEAPSVYPNPAASGATVAFTLAEPADVSVDVFDVLGRRVASVFSGAVAAGPAQWAVPTADLGAGTYLVRVRTPDGVATTPLTVVR